MLRKQNAYLPASQDNKSVNWQKALSTNYQDMLTATLLLILLLASLTSPRSLLFLVVIFIIMMFWELVFSRSRTDPINWGFLCSASLLALLAPIDLALWQLVFCTSLGVVLGEQIFGGRTHTIFSAVVVSLAFAFYSFPNTGIASIDSMPISWLLVPALLLIIFRLLDWLTLFGMLLGIMLLLSLTHPSLDTVLSAFKQMGRSDASFGLCVLFVLGDSALSAQTRLGKLLTGVLAGLLIVFLNPEFSNLEQLVFALLLTSVALPLIDWLSHVLYHTPDSTADTGRAHE